MDPEQIRTVVKRFNGKKISGPFYETFEPGDQLVFLHYGGDNVELSIFTILESIDAPPSAESQYIAMKDIFEAFTAAAK